jgi:hypothetical protein
MVGKMAPLEIHAEEVRLTNDRSNMIRQIKEQIKIAKYHIGSRVPWSEGYVEARTRAISMQIKKGWPSNNMLSAGYGAGFDERIVEIPWAYRQLSFRSGRLWDVGSCLNNSKILRADKLRNKHIFISNLNPERKNYHQYSVSYLYEDILNTALHDAQFNEITCISTLEHIGLNNERYSKKTSTSYNEELYAKAIIVFRRKLKDGGRLFLTFPYGKRSNYGWFQIFDESMVGRIISTFRPTKKQLTVFRAKAGGWEKSDLKNTATCGFFDWSNGKKCFGNIAGSESVVCLAMQK